MAGKGRAPKDPSARVRRNDKESVRVVRTKPGRQPTLDSVIGKKNPITDQLWHPASRRLWRELGSHPTTSKLLPAQWSSLARAVAADDAYLRGQVKLASEARLRLGKFFIDPDDVLRGKFHFVADGDQPQDPDPAPVPDPKKPAAKGAEQPAAATDPRLHLVS